MILPASPANVRRAADLIRAGGAVAFPTETVYGLGADATNAAAVARIFDIKERPSFDPLIVHLADAEHVTEVAEQVPPAAQKLMARFWPGPLTLILPKRDCIPDIVTADLPSVAVRVPDHRIARELIRFADCPVAAPSANRFGCVSPTAAQHVQAQLDDRPAMILDDGPCRVGVESTILSLLSGRPALLRPGGVVLEQIVECVGPVDVIKNGDQRLAPGQSSSHYAPRTKLHLVDAARQVPPNDRSDAALLIVHRKDAAEGFRCVEALSQDGDLVTAAANLFSSLHRLDGAGVRKIYAVRVAEKGLGRAIMDRLRRAAHD